MFITKGYQKPPITMKLIRVTRNVSRSSHVFYACPASGKNWQAYFILFHSGWIHSCIIFPYPVRNFMCNPNLLSPNNMTALTITLSRNIFKWSCPYTCLIDISHSLIFASLPAFLQTFYFACRWRQEFNEVEEQKITEKILSLKIQNSLWKQNAVMINKIVLI